MSMYYVYRIESVNHPSKSYIGSTRSVKGKLRMHNDGNIEHTAANAPWRLSFYAAFTRKERAKAFANFLRMEEGAHFGRKHLWSSKSHSASE